MKVALLGFDVEGRASYDYFRASGDEITVCDQNADLQVPEGVETQLGDSYLDSLDRFDLLVRTPGLHPSKILEKNPNVGHKITSGTNEFFKACPTHNVIGVTGTKGKGTTSTLIAQMLEAAGKKVNLGGNIGTPAVSFLSDVQQDNWVVLELSNFQLIDLQYSPHYAVCLMIVPEHLNWHPDMAEYMAAKSNLFAHQTPEDITIYYSGSNDATDVASAGEGQKIPFSMPPGAAVDNGVISIEGHDVVQTEELKLLGEHNWQNVCAAVTVVWEALNEEMVREHLVEAIRSVLTSFSGLPHRLELVRELEGVRFYNDSFAATPDAAIAAMSAIPGEKVMIVGGFDRQLPLENLAQAPQRAGGVKHVLLVGASGPRLAEAFGAAGFHDYTVSSAKTMPEIVLQARQLASAGDAVVLSPGFASFDMFKNFEDRGNQFREVVKNL